MVRIRGSNWFRMLGVVVVALLPAAPSPARAQGTDLVVFAAASLKNALDSIASQWRKETGKTAKISYAASSALAKQIEQGAPAQMFISADLAWMDYRRGEGPHQGGHALQSARQPHRADRAQGQGAGRRDQAGLRSGQASGQRAAGDGQRRGRACRQIRQGGAGKARRVAERLGQARASRERARGAVARLARRGSCLASSIRRTRRLTPASRSSARSRRTRIRRSSTRWR